MKRRGMSLGEVVIASFILLLGLVFVATMMGNVSRYEATLQERVTAVNLAQYQMDQLLHTPIQNLVPGTSFFTEPPFVNYQYTVSIVPTGSADLEALVVQVTTPDNHTYSVQSVVPVPAANGAAYVPGNGGPPNYVYYADTNFGQIRRVPVLPGAPHPPATLVNISAPMPGGGYPAGLTYVPPGFIDSTGGLWVGNGSSTDSNRLYLFDVVGTFKWDNNQSSPDSVVINPSGVEGPCGGISFQRLGRYGHGNLVYLDQAQHGSWTLTFPNDWKGVSVGGSTAIDNPVAVAACPTTAGAWICDGPNQCLRFQQTWNPNYQDEPTLFKPAAGAVTMGTPRAIACDGSGQNVWIVDNTRIWFMCVWLDTSDIRHPLPVNTPQPPSYCWAWLPIPGASSGSPNDIPSGLCWDGNPTSTWSQGDGTHLWLSTTSGALYEIPLGGLTDAVPPSTPPSWNPVSPNNFSQWYP
jgi:hypothetical protein